MTSGRALRAVERLSIPGNIDEAYDKSGVFPAHRTGFSYEYFKRKRNPLFFFHVMVW